MTLTGWAVVASLVVIGGYVGRNLRRAARATRELERRRQQHP